MIKAVRILDPSGKDTASCRATLGRQCFQFLPLFSITGNNKADILDLLPRQSKSPDERCHVLDRRQTGGGSKDNIILSSLQANALKVGLPHQFGCDGTKVHAIINGKHTLRIKPSGD